MDEVFCVAQMKEPAKSVEYRYPSCVLPGFLFYNDTSLAVYPKSVIRKGSFLIFLMTAIRKMDFHLSDS